MHIRQHYNIYKTCCEAAGLRPHHWAIPQKLWKKMEATRAATAQTTLDSIFQRVSGPTEFLKEYLLEAIIQLIACDDQVRSLLYH